MIVRLEPHYGDRGRRATGLGMEYCHGPRASVPGAGGSPGQNHPGATPCAEVLPK